MHRLFASMLIASLSTAAVAAAAPPPTPRHDVRETLHGTVLDDPYRWLEDQDSPETRAWIDAQNRYTRQALAEIPGRKALEQRLGELLKIDTVSTPVERGGRYFFTRRAADQDLSVIYTRKGLKGKDQVLVDPHGMSADHSTSVGLSVVSDDGSLLGYSVREGGADEVTVRFLDVNTGQELADRMPRARYSGLDVLPDRSGLYYSRHGKEGPRVYFHRFGTAPESDRLVFGEGYGPEKFIGIGLSEGGRYLLILVSYGSAAEKSDVFVLDRRAGEKLVPIVTDIEASFAPEIGGDHLFVLTDWQASNRRVLRVDLNDPRRESWKEIVPASEQVIESMTAAGGRLFLRRMKDVQARITVCDVDGKPVTEIKSPGIGSLSGVSGRWESPEAFYSFSSYSTPPTIYRYRMPSGRKEVWARIQVPIHPEDFTVKQVWFPSKDGTRVPMFMVHKRGLQPDGNRPVLLTGYGGFKNSLMPAYSSIATAWAEAGGVFAVPSLRGGGEFGEAWHQAGMRERKQNTFDDFFAAAEWLIANRYTNPDRLAIAGGSNGGLLVGAALTQRPELFRAVMCSYPLLDMVRYHRFLVARFWVPEYGSSDDAQQFRTLLSYSPYHRVKKGTRYPAVLFVTGDADTRVAPLHARKMAALLQWAQGGDRPILLDYDTKAGHSGGKPLSRQIEDSARQYAFLLWQLGVDYGKDAQP